MLLDDIPSIHQQHEARSYRNPCIVAERKRRNVFCVLCVVCCVLCVVCCVLCVVDTVCTAHTSQVSETEVGRGFESLEPCLVFGGGI